MRAVAPDNYTYAETNYANPHALTGYFNGSATTTYSYDAIGNLATTTGAATSTFMWDYRNRMLRAWVSGATSTYQYDHTIARMRQVFGSTTTDYPNRFYSLATSTQSGSGTSTAYIWHGDTLVATIEQRLVNGVASGTATTYYYHPDHLGSTNAITNSAGVVKQALDYYPYGASRINTGMDASDRRFIGQFADDATSLDYLNARYYDPGRGQFVSQDPLFLALGSPQAEVTAKRTREQLLSDPQLLNSYNYARSNPINLSDPTGEIAPLPIIAGAFLIAGIANTGINLMDMTTVFGYPDQFSQQDKVTAVSKFAFGVATLGMGNALPTLAQRVGFDTLGATLDVIDQFAPEEAYRNFKPRYSTEAEMNKKRSTPLPAGSQGSKSHNQTTLPMHNNSTPMTMNNQSGNSQSRDAALRNISASLKDISFKLSTWGASAKNSK